jgi:phosphocarrier protein HPr
MTEHTLTVTNDTGLHSRPADLFVRTAKLYEAQITVHKGEKSADAKNIIKLILLNVSQGTRCASPRTGPTRRQRSPIFAPWLRAISRRSTRR